MTRLTMNDLKEGNSIALDLETLYKHTNGKLQFGKIVELEQDNIFYYDLINDMQQLACMDGEFCTIVKIREDYIFLENDNGDDLVYFKLVVDELLNL